MNYASVKALADVYEGGATLLTGSSVALFISALAALENRWIWVGSGEQGGVSDAEWNEMDRMLSLAAREIMSGITGMFSYFVNVPEGALLCDGATYNRVDYPRLYEHWIGTSLIVDSDTFTVPNLEDLVMVGASATKPALSQGGEESHVLSVDEIPSHSHTYTPVTLNLDLESPGVPDIQGAGIGLPTQTSSVGGGLAHNNMQPYVALKAVVWT